MLGKKGTILGKTVHGSPIYVTDSGRVYVDPADTINRTEPIGKEKKKQILEKVIAERQKKVEERRKRAANANTRQAA